MGTSSPPVAESSERLLAVDEITQVMHRYAYYVDRHDWESFESLFTVDATLDEQDMPAVVDADTDEPVSDELHAHLERVAASTAWPIVGRDRIRQQLSKVPDEHVMFHHVFNPWVEVTSDTTANALFYYEAHHWLPPGGPLRRMHNFGIYHGTFARLDDGRWYIESLRLQRRRVECR